MMAEKIRFVLTARNKSKSWLAKQLGMTSSNFYRRLERDDMRETDMIRIAEILDCDLELNLVLKDTGRKF